MKIRSEITITNRVYAVQVEIYELTPLERELLAQFGMPEIAVGGSFSGSATRPGAGSPTATTFTLPDESRRLPADFPVKQVFSLDDFADADIRATVYQTTIHSRITSAHTTLTALAANFVGESITTIS